MYYIHLRTGEIYEQNPDIPYDGKGLSLRSITGAQPLHSLYIKSLCYFYTVPHNSTLYKNIRSWQNLFVDKEELVKLQEENKKLKEENKYLADLPPLTQDFVVDSYVEDGIEMSADKARKITNTKSDIEGMWKDIDELIEINARLGLNEVGTMLATKYAHNTILRYRNKGFVVNYSDNKLRISW